MDVLHITVHRDIALFILNHKRASLADIESRFGLTIILHSDDSLIAPEYRVEREGFQGKSQPRQNGRQNRKKPTNPMTMRTMTVKLMRGQMPQRPIWR